MLRNTWLLVLDVDKYDCPLESKSLPNVLIGLGENPYDNCSLKAEKFETF